MSTRWESRQFIVRMTLGLVSFGAFVVWASRRGRKMWGEAASGKSADDQVHRELT
jgi:hypothetical protein